MRKYLVLMCLAVFLMMSGYFLQWIFPTKNQWQVSLSSSSLKGKDQYDVIIVGGGFGGLSCGALLAQNGYKVLLCDKNLMVGGLCSGYSENGFTFCYGAEDILGLSDRGSLTYLMHKLQMEMRDYFVENSCLFLDGGASIYVPGYPNAFEEVLIQQYPDEKTGLERLFSMARAVYNEKFDRAMISRWGICLPDEIAKGVMDHEWLANYETTHAHLLEWQKKTYQEVVDEYIVNSNVKLLLCGVVANLGKRPIDIKAAEVVVHTFGSFFFGGFHALGSPHRFAEALKTYIEGHNGTVLTSTYVERIDFENRAVCGIDVQGKKYWSHIVVSDIDVRALFSELMPKNAQTKEFVKTIHGCPYGRSTLCVHLAVNDPLSNYPSLIRDRMNSTFIAIPSSRDPSLAPPDCSTVVVRELVDLVDFIGRPRDELLPYVEKRVADLIKRAERLVPPLKQNATIVKIVTPETYETLANIPNGAIFGFDTSESGRKPYFKTPFKGLYLTSATAQNGVGVQEVVSNGILCAHDIMQWQE